MHDLRYALRGLARSPGFALAAILTLALGVGAVTSIFSVADAVLLRPLPYPESHRLVMVWDELTKLGVERLGLYGQIFHEYAAQDQVFDATAAFEVHDRNLVGDRDSERIATIAATPGLFPMLGVRPALGRGFSTLDQDVALLSHALFVRRFSNDSTIIGERVRLDGNAYTIIGVMPPNFEFGERSDIWTPLAVPNSVGMGTLRMLARLRSGVSLESARVAMNAEAQHLAETDRPHFGPNGEDPGFRVKLIPLRDELLGSFRTTALVLMGAVGSVLLIACVNIANLIWVRSVIREKETAIRRALGASQSRLIRQWLTEAAVIAAAGGTLGAIAAQWGVRVLIALTSGNLPAASHVQVDGRALWFTLLVSCAVCLIFALAPALASRRIYAQLRGARPKSRGASSLVAIETALAVLLLIGAGLLLKSFSLLRHIDPGFNPEHVLTMRTDLSPARYPDTHRRLEFFDALRDRIKALPGVIAVGMVSRLPIANHANASARGGNPFSIQGQRWHPDGPVPQMAHTQIADAGYFRTLQIPLLEGRSFEETDLASGPRVVIVNEKLARGFFPKGAIGKQILLGAPQPGAKWMTIVGVVGDVKTGALAHETMPQFYTPETQDADGNLTLVVRTTSDPPVIARDAASLAHSIYPEQPIFDISTLDQRIERSIGQPRFETSILSFFAVAALFLAAIGIFGVVADSTARRTQEIGIRMALGADRARVLRHVVGDGLRPVAIGMVVGLGAAIAIGRVLSTMLFHVAPRDPQIFAGAAATLALVAILACLLPARKASRIDPINSLRSE